MKQRIAYFCRQFFILMVCVLLASVALQVKAQNSDKLNNIDSKLIEVQTRLHLIAQYMGVTLQPRALYQVANVSPREVYYQALRLYFKVAQLYYDINGHEVLNPDITAIANPHPVEVLELLDQSNTLLQEIMQKFRLKQLTASLPQTSASNWSQLFERLALINQMANQLLEKEAQPSDVYQNVTLAIYYMGEILKTMPGINVITQPLPHIPNKKPSDVYNELLLILKQLNAIAKQLHLKMLVIKDWQNSQAKIMPNDVQELSQIILSQLAYIAAQKNIDVSSIKSYYPGKKYPADVYQRATILKQQLDKMYEYIQQHPDWLVESKNAKTKTN